MVAKKKTVVKKPTTLKFVIVDGEDIHLYDKWFDVDDFGRSSVFEYYEIAPKYSAAEKKKVKKTAPIFQKVYE